MHRLLNVSTLAAEPKGETAMATQWTVHVYSFRASNRYPGATDRFRTAILNCTDKDQAKRLCKVMQAFTKDEMGRRLDLPVHLIPEQDMACIMLRVYTPKGVAYLDDAAIENIAAEYLDGK